MAFTDYKRPYIVVVRKNIINFLIKTKQNMKKFCNEVEENFTPAFKLYENCEVIDENEQNKFNEELERKLAAA